MHMLERNQDGKYAFAYTGEHAWHGLGTQIILPEGEVLQPMELARQAGVDWRVAKAPMYRLLPGNDAPTLVPGVNSLYRETDCRHLSVVTDDWKETQNEEAFKFFQEFIDAGNMTMETAGSIRDGKMVFALAKIKDEFEILGGDRVKGYLLFSNPHEFGKSIDVRFTPIRVVCNNTLTMALAHDSRHRVTINHRKTFDAAEVKETLGIAQGVFGEFEETARQLSAKRYTPETVAEYFTQVFPLAAVAKGKKGNVVDPATEVDAARYADKKVAKAISRNAGIALDAIETQPGAEFAPGSWWNAFNCVTFMTNHVIGRSADTRLNSAWFGPNQVTNLKAMRLAKEFAEKA